MPLTSFASSLKIINDTGSKMSVHTGSGIANLNKGGSTSVTCKPGKKIYTANKGTKGSFLFKVTSSHCGTSVKLSSVM
ncbi:MAG: hypothetical protein Q9M50_01160 [Methylococcales bacterium]|nr:hypothetical protein [Methylococcales bacterium]